MAFFLWKNARAADRRPYGEIRDVGRMTGDADPSAALRALRMTAFFGYAMTIQKLERVSAIPGQAGIDGEKENARDN